jgi:hypothetical protein
MRAKTMRCNPMSPQSSRELAGQRDTVLVG